MPGRIKNMGKNMKKSDLGAETPGRFHRSTNNPRTAELGLMLVALLLLTPAASRAQTFSVLYNFASVPGTGAWSKAPLLRDSTGNLYGTTSANTSVGGNGLVFKIDAQDEYSILYSFAGVPDGYNPTGALIEDGEGNLYGTTLDGGAYYGGTVFKLAKTGEETLLHSFSGSTGDGIAPYAGLIRDGSGDLFGTTTYGGTGSCSGGCGTVFEISKAGVETVLYSFPSTAVGSYPASALVRDSEGNLYGTTYYGGLSCNCGTVFKLHRSGSIWEETVLHEFSGGLEDGSGPEGSLVLDPAGNIYGTTYVGGAHSVGTIYKMTPQGKVTLLHSFNYSDGAYPASGLVQDAQGNFYGTTLGGRSHTACGVGCGTIFKLTGAGVETVLFAYPNNGNDGEAPNGVILDSEENLYGTSAYNGINGGFTPGPGNVFKLSQ
jgi:uncharacterized repeat protein (TIGR03803 family)